METLEQKDPVCGIDVGIKRYRIACDDADAESCSYVGEGSSLDELYQVMVKHRKTVHPEIKRPIDPEYLKKTYEEMMEEVDAHQNFSKLPPK